jgi:ribosomal protein L7/L12
MSLSRIERIRIFREAHQCSLIEAKEAIQVEELRNKVREADCIKDLKAVLLEMLDIKLFK